MIPCRQATFHKGSRHHSVCTAALASPGAAPASAPPAPAAPASSRRRVIVARSLSMTTPPTVGYIGPAGTAGKLVSDATSGAVRGRFRLGPPHLGLLLPEHDRLQQVQALLQALVDGHQAVLVLDRHDVVVVHRAQRADDVPPGLLA